MRDDWRVVPNDQLNTLLEFYSMVGDLNLVSQPQKKLRLTSAQLLTLVKFR
jgi:hypothetical protein